MAVLLADDEAVLAELHVRIIDRQGGGKREAAHTGAGGCGS